MASIDFRRLRQQLARATGRIETTDVDYQIVESIGRLFIAKARTGAPAILVPLEIAPIGAGRSGGGFSLRAIDRLAFKTSGKAWQQPAATFELTDPDSVDAFLVLAQDMSERLGEVDAVDWAAILSWLEEWQALLTRGSAMSAERQLGLWGELWLIARSSDPSKLMDAWCGPDREATDFFHDGIGLEVKVSRRPLIHHISQRQADRPVGEHRAFLVSMWVGVDQAAGVSLAELVDAVLALALDPPKVLKRIVSVGYVPTERHQYVTRFALLETPHCFRSEHLPRVGMIDAGITEVRYLATLDPDKALADADVAELFQHFSQSTAALVVTKGLAK
jgi:hypothetical protein